MRLYKLDLLTLLISLFILSGCEPSDSLGLKIDSENQINGAVEEIAVKTRTVNEDSVRTNLLVKYPLGYLIDPKFGITDAKVAMSLNLPSSSLTFGDLPVLDSAVLVLKYANEFYGDSTSTFKFDVFQLEKQLTATTNYLNTTEHGPILNPIIGTKTAIINIKDSVSVSQIIDAKPDTKKNQAPQIRIPIDPTFITTNFFNAGSTYFADNTAFNAFIKGLYVTAKPQGAKAGGTVFLDLSSADGSKLELYYKNTTGTTIDTNIVSFSIQNSIAPVAATFTHNYTGTEIETQLADKTVKEYDHTFVQPLDGVRTQVNFSDLNKLKALGNISINKAELILSVKTLPGDIFKPAPRLFLYTTDIAERRKLVPDVDDRDARALPDEYFGGFYDTAKNRYTFTLTAYIQDLLRDKLKPYHIYVTSADPKVNSRSGLNAQSSGALDPLFTTGGRVVLEGGENSGSPVPVKMKLRIIYTKVN